MQNMIETNGHTNIESKGVLKDSSFNLKDFLHKYFSYWPWIAGFVILFSSLAFLYIRYTSPVYIVTSKILIKDDVGTSAATQDILSDIDILNTKNNVNDEIQVLQTRFLISKVVDELKLNISYFITGNIKSSELYKNAPFRISILSLNDSNLIPQRLDFKFIPNSNAFELEHNDVKGNYNLYDTIKLDNIIFTVEPVKANKKLEGNYFAIVSTADAITDKYLHDINSEIADKEANVILLTLRETSPKKGEDILNKLYEVYTLTNQYYKDATADSTINFINQRLEIVANELSGVEQKVEQFKTQNKLYTNLGEQGTLTLNNMSELQKQVVQQQVQINIIESMETHIKNGNSRVVPNAADIQDPTYISAVEKYNNMVLERDRQLQTTKSDNPLIKNLDKQIEIMRADLLTHLNAIKAGMITTRNELQKKNAQLMGDIKKTPSKEHAFLDISRQQEVKQQLYIYLLQKREETAITKSATAPNSRLIEPAKSDQMPFAPKKQLIYVIAFALGLLISIAFVYFKELLNNRITSGKDITKALDIPVIGEIGHNSSDEAVVIKQNSRTPLSEQFRILRTNLQFILKGKKQVILITSSRNAEGKSFISINLACSLAISGKRVVLMELDLRIPQVSKNLGDPGGKGFSDYVVGGISREELIKPTTIHPNLFLISAGTLPPNPAELLLEKNVAELFQYLRTNWDYIIVDTPPVGLVTDAVIIANNADAGIYIVRQNFTFKQQLSIVKDLVDNSKIPNLSILINDVEFKARYGYGYGYGYTSNTHHLNSISKNKLFYKKKQ